MAIQEANLVVQALQNALAGMQRNQEFAQDREFKQKQFEEEQKQNAIHKEAADRLYKVQKAQLDSEQAQRDFANSQIFQQTGITPPGAQVIPGIQPQQQPPTQIQVPQINQSSPVFGSPQVGVGATYPGLTDQAQQKPLVLSDLQNSRVVNPSGSSQVVPPLEQSPSVKLAEQKAAEANARKIIDQQLLQQAEEKRQLNVMQATQVSEGERMLKVMGQEHTYKQAEIAQQLQGNKDLESMRAKAQLDVARMRSGGGLEDFAQMPNAVDTLTRMRTGTLSQEEVNKSPFKKQISAYAVENGIQILPQAKSNQIAALETMGNILPTIREMINLRELHPLKVNNPLTDIGQQYKKDVDTLRAAAPQASVATTGVRRFTQQELERFDDFFIPGKNPLTSGTAANLSKYNEFVTNLNQSMDQVTKGLSGEQKDAILSNLKSKGLIYTKPAGVTDSPSGTSPSTGGISKSLTGREPQVQLGPKQGIKVWKQNPRTGALELAPE